MVKKMLASKTFWAQIIGVVATLAGVFGLELTADEQAAFVTAAVSLWAVVNVILRRVTHQPVRF